MKRNFQWRIDIYCVTTSNGFSYWVEIDGQVRFKIGQEYANDCTEVMGIVGDYIGQHGFPDKLVSKRDIKETIASH